MLSVSLPMAFLPLDGIARGLRAELDLWRQEVDLLARKMLPQPVAQPTALQRPLLDVGLAKALLELPTQATRQLAGECFG